MAAADPLEREVLEANQSFYRAFNQRDFAAMSALWAERAPVACLHPGQPLLVGREAVLRSWREILTTSPGFTLRSDDASVQLFGDTAIVYCYEGGDHTPAHLAVTNVFVREDGVLRMVHHHAGPLSAPRARRSQLFN